MKPAKDVDGRIKSYLTTYCMILSVYLYVEKATRRTCSWLAQMGRSIVVTHLAFDCLL